MKLKKSIAILLCLILAFSSVSLFAVSASAAADDVTIHVTSNLPDLFPASTAVVSGDSEQVTVTYWLNIEDYDLVNCQWRLSYDNDVLVYDDTDGVNQTGNHPKTYLIIKPAIGVQSSTGQINLNANSTNPAKTVIKGNCSSADGYEIGDEGKTPFISVTFNLNDERSADEATVNLSVDVLQVRPVSERTANPPSVPTYFVQNGAIVDNNVPFTSDATYAQAYEGAYDPDYEPFTLADGFYLIGSNGWNVTDLTAADKFELNPANQNEYMLDATLTVGDEIKVVSVADTAITGWYPDGTGNNYVVDAAHAGNVTIYFSTAYNNDWADFGGYFFIPAAPVGPQYIADFAPTKSSLVLTEGILMSFNVQKSLLTGYENPYLVITYKNSYDQDVEVVVDTYTNEANDQYYRFRFNDLLPQMLTTELSAVLYATKDGVVYYGDAYTDSVRGYIDRAFAAYTNPNASQKKLLTLLTELANYGAAVQTRLGYKTNALANADLPQTYAVKDEDVELVNERDFNYSEPDNYTKTAQWTACALVLDNVIETRAKFALNDGESIDGKYVVARFIGFNNLVEEYTYTEFQQDNNGRYYFLFNHAYPQHMGNYIYFTVYNENDEVCSPTMQYTMNSYLQLATTTLTDATLVAMLNAVAKYGVATKAYVGG